MAQRVLSILLGSEIVKVCEIALAGKKRVQVYNAIDLVIPPGLCDDGVIQNAEVLASTILEGLKGEGFTSRKIIFTLASKRIASKEAVIPYCKENKIKQIVDINASEYFPIANMNDYVVNYSIIEMMQNEGVKNYRLSVIATPKEIIAQYYELARFMKMSVQAIDYAGNASLQLLKLQASSGEVDAILQVGSESTTVNVMDGQTMVMQRSIPYGRGAFVEAVKFARNVPDSVADIILTEEDISDIANRSADVADAVRAMFSSVNRILEFYSTRNPDRPIEHIYMLGDAISINGLAELFTREWERAVVLIETLHGIEIKNHNNVSAQIAANYISNIGAILAPMKIEYIEQEATNKTQKMPWWIFIFSGIVSAGMIGGVLILYNGEKNEVDNIRNQIYSLGEVEDLEEEYLRVQEEQNIISSWYDSTKSANESIVKFVDDLEEVQPSDISISQFTANAGELRMTGNANSKNDVAEFVIQLKKLPYVTNVKTEYITESVEDFSRIDNFSIAVNLLYDDPYSKDYDNVAEVEANTLVREDNVIEEGEINE